MFQSHEQKVFRKQKNSSIECIYFFSLALKHILFCRIVFTVKILEICPTPNEVCSLRLMGCHFLPDSPYNKLLNFLVSECRHVHHQDFQLGAVTESGSVFLYICLLFYKQGSILHHRHKAEKYRYFQNVSNFYCQFLRTLRFFYFTILCYH